MEDKEIKMLEAMKTYGGSFVKSLAECYLHADPHNKNKLKFAFSKYFKEYSQKADALRPEQC